ncbi:MAG: DinB family protein [Candidatus Methylomirabilales bacterium]
MGMSEALLPEFDHEMANTRKTLERVPEGKLGWKPHEKSMTMGRLAVHLAEIPGWASLTIEQDSFDFAPPGAPPYQPPQANSRKEILAIFDDNVAAARAAIAGADDGQLKKPWSALSGGKTAFTLPRIGVLRSFIMNHSIHHRAQLGVYLRLNNVPVPAIYGPSADEGGM